MIIGELQIKYNIYRSLGYIFNKYNSSHRNKLPNVQVA